MESQNKVQSPRWLACYQREENILDLCNYELSVAYMQLVADDIKDIVRSKIIDHQQLKEVNVCKSH